MIDIQRVRELAELMAEQGLSEIRVRDGDATIQLRKGPLAEPASAAAPVAASPAPGPAPGAPVAREQPGPQDNLVPIISPMVGTFYSAPDPDSGPFVQVGTEVDANTPVCIIEAMKVFNEIKAEVAGTVERILVHDEQAVEYGQPLMLVRPK